MRTIENVCRRAAMGALLALAWVVVVGVEAPAVIKDILCVLAILGAVQTHAMIRQALWMTCEREKEIRRLNKMLDDVYKSRGHFYEERDDRHKPPK